MFQPNLAAAAAAAVNQVPLPRPIVARPLPEESGDDHEDFWAEFENRVLDVVGRFRQRYPYKHSVIWSMKFGGNQEHAIHVMANRVQPQVGVVNQIIPRPLPGECQDEMKEFIQEFDDRVLAGVRQIRQRFPYEQLIQWSMEFGESDLTSIEVLVRARRT